MRCYNLPARHVCLVLAVAAASSSARADDAPSLRLDGRRDGDALALTVHATPPTAALDSLLIFIDADTDAKTGFQSGIDGRFGFDAMIQNDGLFAFTGTAGDRTTWTWERVGDAAKEGNVGTMTIRVPAAALKSKQVGVAAWLMSADNQSRVAAANDGELTRVEVGEAVANASTRPAVAMIVPRADRALPARQRFANAKSFYTYYGAGKVAGLSHYDALVLHTPQMKSEDVKTLSKLGVVTVGYISVGEDDQLHVGDGKGPAGKAGWYFDRDKDGQPDQNGIWKSWFANAGDPAWRAGRVAEAKRLIDYGFDGIFLDTIDTSTNYAESKPGMIQLVRELRAALPDAVIVLNQGFEVLADVAPLADGLMLESFTATYDFDSKTYMLNHPASLDFHTRRVQRTIEPVRKQHPLNVLVLDYAKREDHANMQAAADRAATFGYLFSAAPIFLDDVYDDVPRGTPDPKWLQLQSSPDQVAFTLPDARNGFAAGTRVRPSGCFAGYGVAAIVDGTMDRRGIAWNKAAWASSEDGEAAWVEFNLPAARRGGALHVYFHDESGPSQTYRVDAKLEGSDQWTTIERVTNNAQRDRVHTLKTEKPYTAIRLWQDPGGGSKGRPELLWLAQVVLE